MKSKSDSKDSKYPKNMLVETVRERKGGVLQPVGVMVGINDAADGISCIRTGWSRCKLPPVLPKAPTIGVDMTYLDMEGLRIKYVNALDKYRRDVKSSDSFNMERGVAEACQNILFPSKLPVGRNFGKKYAAFQDRCLRYFRDVTLVLDNGKTRSVAPRISRRKGSMGSNGSNIGISKKSQESFPSLLSPFLNDVLIEEFIRTNPLPAGMTANDARSILKDVMSGKVSTICNNPNCPIHGVKAQKSVASLNNLLGSPIKAPPAPVTPIMPAMMALPPEVQRIAKALESIIGPIKIVGIRKIG